MAAVEELVVDHKMISFKEGIQIAGSVAIIHAHTDGVNEIAKTIILLVAISCRNSRISLRGFAERRVGISFHVSYSNKPCWLSSGDAPKWCADLRARMTVMKL